MQDLTDEEALSEIGRRLRRARMNQNLTQGQLADRAGLRQATISRVESGHDFTIETLIALLRALGRLANLDAFLPTAEVSPIELAQRSGRERQRVRHRTTEDDTSWRWSDESGQQTDPQGSQSP